MLDTPHSDTAGHPSPGGAAPARPAAGLAVLIVGMHRSGTSALGGMLNKLGVAVPEDLFPADEHNARGYFEPERIIRFHEALLDRLGSPSNDPLPLTYDWVDGPVGRAAAAELAGLLDQEFGDNALCLFKDPRMCRLAPVWTAALALSGRPGVAVLPCRHPLEVAGSLLAKGALSRPYALFMWLQHVLLGERFTRDLPRSFTFYDDLIDDWRAVAEKLERELRIGWPRDLVRAAPDIDAFLSTDMRHHAARAGTLAPHDPLDALCARTWATLGDLVRDPVDAAAMTRMDAIWAEFEAAFGVFGPLVVSYQRDLEATRDDVRKVQAEAVKRYEETVERERQFLEREHQFVELGQARERQFSELDQARERRLVELDRARQHLRERLIMRDGEIRAIEAVLRDRERDLAEHSYVLTHRNADVARLNIEVADLGRLNVEVADLIACNVEASQLVDRLNADNEALRHELAAHSHALRAAWARAEAIEASTSWKLATALRSPLSGRPRLRRAIRGVLKLGWWTATFKLGRKLGERRAFMAAPADAQPYEIGPAQAVDPAGPVQPVDAPDDVLAPDLLLIEAGIDETGIDETGIDETGADELVGEPAPDAVPEPEAEVQTEGDGAEGDQAGGEVGQTPGPAPAPHVVFLSGEASTPGHVYRVERYAEAARAVGARTTVVKREEVADRLADFDDADLLFIWRAAWDEQVEAAIGAAHAAGARIMFDIDDLLMEPEQARAEIIDGIRSQRFTEESVRGHFELMLKTFQRADYCSSPTDFLTQRLRRHGQPAFVLPNGFDEGMRQRTSLAARARRLQPSDGLLRIGYATGSRTHQKDFGAAAEAIARILREYPQARLVAFTAGWGPVLDVAEFPAFDGLFDQIEWRTMVPIQQLPDEMARFDINVAPLEVGNIFCESKSELKFFEAALAGVPTVASPTGPFKKAVRHGVTGYLAETADEWYVALKTLMDDPDLRDRMAKGGEFDALTEYGPERRAEVMASVLDQVLSRGRKAARAFELDLERAARPRQPIPHIPPHEIVLAFDQVRPSEATVVIPLYNYARFVEEALESVCAQTVEDLDLIVVDDGSTDDSLAVARLWIEGARDRFNRVLLIRNRENSGLAFTRNVGFANADTPFVIPLDADNRLRPDCIERLLEVVKASGAAFAYPELTHFGDEGAPTHFKPYDPSRFVIANYVDAMALIRRSAWTAAGGYDHVRFGWEDYDFWCRLVERGLFGQFLAEPLAEYRIHPGSMLRSETDTRRNKLALINDIERRHPWLRIDRNRHGVLELPDDPAA